MAPLDLSDDEFDAIVDDAFDAIPEALLEHVDNLVFVVEDEPEDGSDTLGVYEGHALTERDLSLIHI